ncbi:B-box zinc finger protein [Chloroflexota bacterium]
MIPGKEMRCATHPETETNLRCGKCGKLICPKCMVQTPVGARCSDCAKLYKLPTYRVPAGYYVRAAGAALGIAIVVGLVWGVVESLLPFFFFNLLLGAGVGYAIGEVISLSVNRKRSRLLAATGGIAVVIGYLVNILTFGSFRFNPMGIIIDLIALGIGIYVATNRLR